MGYFNGPFVLVDPIQEKTFDRVFRNRKQALTQIDILNQHDYDSITRGGWKMITVDVPEDASDAEIIQIAKEKAKLLKKENYKVLNQFLGEDEVTEYTKSKETNQYEDIFNDFVNGNLEDFKNQVRTAKDLALLLKWMEDSGIIQIPDIRNMINLLSR